MSKVKGRSISSEDLNEYVQCMDENFICDELYFENPIPLNDFIEKIERLKFTYDAKRYFRKEKNVDHFTNDEAVYIQNLQFPEHKSIDTDLMVYYHADDDLDKAYYIIGKEYKEDQKINYPFQAIPVNIGPEGIYQCS